MPVVRIDRALLRAKLRAFGIHVAISAVVFAAVIAYVVSMWFPPPYFWIDGGLAMIALAAAVDLVAGPTLTFLFYRPGRRDNAFNLMTIAFIQVAALGWGVQVLHTQRPLYAVYVGGPVQQFFPVTEGMLEHSRRPRDELDRLSSERPGLVFVPLASNEEQARGMLMSGMMGGPSLLASTQLWMAIEGKALDAVAAGGRPLDAMRAKAPDADAKVNAFLAAHGGTFEDYAFVPLLGRYRSALLGLDRKTGRLAGVVYVNYREEMGRER